MRRLRADPRTVHTPVLPRRRRVRARSGAEVGPRYKWIALSNAAPEDVGPAGAESGQCAVLAAGAGVVEAWRDQSPPRVALNSHERIR